MRDILGSRLLKLEVKKKQENQNIRDGFMMFLLPSVI